VKLCCKSIALKNMHSGHRLREFRFQNEHQHLTGVKDRMATMELRDLVARGILVRIGKTGRGTRYAAKKPQKAQQ
jgi:Fic family protein